MAHQLVWAPLARQDLLDLFNYIAPASPNHAKQFIQKIFHEVERLIEFPQSGRVVPEFNNPSIREVLRKPCRIVYRVSSDSKTIEIIRVWHAARGIPGIEE